MDIHSCKGCGIVVDLDKIKFIDSEIPDDPDDDERDEDGYFKSENLHFNSDAIWPRHEMGPLDTWKCPVCNEFNAKGED